MNIQNNPQALTLKRPNFKAIKSVKCEGLYKKFPAQAKEIVDTFKSNEVAMNFCKNHDVNIVFYAIKVGMEAVENSIHIFFKNPAKKKFLGLFGSQKDKISLSAFSDEFNMEKSFINSTNRLKNYIINDPKTGMLNSHINIKEKEINKVLLTEKNNLLIKKAKELKEKEALQKFKDDTVDLKKSLNDLVENSK